MSKPLKRRIECAISGYLRAVFPEAIPVLDGHSAGERTLPCVIVYGEEERALPPLETGLAEVQLRVFVLTQADDEDVAAQDRRVELVAAALGDRDVVRAAVNASPEAVRLYEIEPGQFTEGRDERHHGESMGFVVTCQAIVGTAGE
jgi:hypothetical protein